MKVCYKVRYNLTYNNYLQQLIIKVGRNRRYCIVSRFRNVCASTFENVYCNVAEDNKENIDKGRIMECVMSDPQKWLFSGIHGGRQSRGISFITWL
jgi:hypothetical protein